MSSEIENTLVLAFAFLVLFGGAEWLYQKCSVSAEVTRKIVHTGTALIALLFPVLLDSHWYVLILSLSFLAILSASLKWRLLPSINAIERRSLGSLVYPGAVYGCFLIYEKTGFQSVYYYLPIAILGFSDPAAAFAGKVMSGRTPRFTRFNKTFPGSVAFFVTAFLASALLLSVLDSETITSVLTKSFFIALSGTLAEACSTRGVDNLTVPFAVILAIGCCNQF